MNRRNNLQMTNGMAQYPPPFQHPNGMRPGTQMPPNYGPPINRPPMQAGNQPNHMAFQNGFSQPIHRGPEPPPTHFEPKGGGILSKLKRKSQSRGNAAPVQNPFSLPASSTRHAATATAATAAAGTAASGGILKSIMNPANLSTMLDNTQKVLQATESITPYVQQYAPIVKNIPSLWKQITGTKEETKDTQEQTEIQPEAPVQKQPIVTEQRETNTFKSNIATKAVNRTEQYKPHIQPIQAKELESPSTITWRKGESKPKLFI
ncbi:MAG: VrrA/YqfQ family protein [Bacillus sp. (in: firmicutes)]